MKRGFSLIEIILSMAIFSFIMLAFYSFIIGSISILSDIKKQKNALDEGRLVLYRLQEELQGKIKKDTIIFNQGTSAISFDCDYNHDGTYETIAYFLGSGTIEKSIDNGSHFVIRNHCESSEIIGTTNYVTAEIYLRDNNGILLFRLRTGINPR